MLTALQDLTQSLASVSKTPPADCLNVSSDETRQPSQNVSIKAWYSTGLNVPDRTQPTNNLRLRKSTSTASSEEPPQQEDAPAGDPDDRVSVAVSNQWFQDLRPNSNPKHGAMADGDKMLEEDQAYWQDSLGDYGDPDVYESEISSSIASASKTFWEKPLKEDSFKRKFEAGKLPSNCTYLTTKFTNPEIFINLPTFQRTVDSKIQDIQKVHAASVSLLSTTASYLGTSSLTTQGQNKETDFKIPLNFLKDSLSLAGKANQMLNQLRRQLIKPTLPPKYCQLADIADDSATYLFGDKISEVLETLNKEHQLRSLLNDKSFSSKQKFQESSNYASSSKTQKRTDYNLGQKQRSTQKKHLQKPYQHKYNRTNQHKSHNYKHRN